MHTSDKSHLYNFLGRNTTVLEELLIPWWKLPIYVLSIGLTTVCVRIAITFDVNAWLQKKQEDKQKKEALKRVNECSHIWTLYRSSTHSRCDRCGCLISTTLLLSANEFSKRGKVPAPTFSGEANRMLIHVGVGDIITDDYVGKMEE